MTMKIEKNEIIYKLYLITLGVALGMIVAVGALSAPVVFHANDMLGSELLTHYQMGLIMTEIFVRSNYLLGFATLFITIFEWRSFWFERDRVNVIVAIVTILTALLFLFYYTPAILEMQRMGAEATQSQAFEGMHIGSEIAYKILLVTIGVLLYRRVGMKPAWLR
jgi:signal transduction histidine kinase